MRVLGVRARCLLLLLLRLHTMPVKGGVRETSRTGRILVTIAILGGRRRAGPAVGGQRLTASLCHGRHVRVCGEAGDARRGMSGGDGGGDAALGTRLGR